MQEIIYRAWNVDDEIMGEPLNFSTGEGALRLYNSMRSDQNIVLMQWTGLVDVDGKKIFDGDIVKTSERFVGIVHYHINNDYGSAEFVVVTDRSFDDSSFECINSNPLVLGNMYQHHELLEMLWDEN